MKKMTLTIFWVYMGLMILSGVVGFAEVFSTEESAETTGTSRSHELLMTGTSETVLTETKMTDSASMTSVEAESATSSETATSTSDRSETTTSSEVETKIRLTDNVKVTDVIIKYDGSPIAAGDTISANKPISFELTYEINDPQQIKAGDIFTIPFPSEYFKYMSFNGKTEQLKVTLNGRELVIGTLSWTEEAGITNLQISFNDELSKHQITGIQGAWIRGGAYLVAEAGQSQTETGPIIIGGIQHPGFTITEPAYTPYPETIPGEQEWYGEFYKEAWQADPYDPETDPNELVFNININTDNYVENLLKKPNDPVGAQTFHDRSLRSQKAGEPLILRDELEPDLRFVRAKFLHNLFYLDTEGTVYTHASTWFTYQSWELKQDFANSETLAQFEERIKKAPAGTYGIYTGKNQAGVVVDTFLANLGQELGVTDQKGTQTQFKDQYLQSRESLAESIEKIQETGDLTEEEIPVSQQMMEYLFEVSPTGATHLLVELYAIPREGVTIPEDPWNPWQNTATLQIPGGQEKETSLDTEAEPYTYQWITSGGNALAGGTIKIEKRDISTESFLDGVTFEIYNKSDPKTVVDTLTTAAGTASSNKVLPAGEYFLKETLPATGYGQTIYVKQGGAFREATAADLDFVITGETDELGLVFHYYNEKNQVDLPVEKRWRGGDPDQRPAVTFQLQQRIGNTWEDVKGQSLTLKDGQYQGQFKNLEKRDTNGELIGYRIRETFQGTDYQQVEAENHIYDWNDPTTPMIITNEYQPKTAKFKLAVKKLAADTGEPLTGASFTLTDKNQPERQWPLVSDPNDGSLHHLEGVEAGTYLLLETKAPTDFQLLGEPIEITITAEGEAVMSDGSAINKTEDQAGITFTLAIHNRRQLTLPEAGGNGSASQLFLGSLLMVIGSGYLLFPKLKKIKAAFWP